MGLTPLVVALAILFHLTTSDDGVSTETAKIFTHFLRKAGLLQRRKGLALDEWVPPTARLRVVYKGSNRQVHGCNAAVVSKRLVVLPSFCVSSKSGAMNLNVSRSTVGGVPMKAIYTPVRGLVAAVATKNDLPGAVAKIGAAGAPLEFVWPDGDTRSYENRTYAQCKAVAEPPGGEDRYACAMPTDGGVYCPASAGVIAFDKSNRAAKLVGWSAGGDCADGQQLGVTYIVKLLPYRDDIESIIKDGESDAYNKHV